LHGLSATAGLLVLVKEHIFEFNQNFFKSQTMHFNATCTESKVKEQGKLNMHIIFESVLMLFTRNYQN